MRTLGLGFASLGMLVIGGCDGGSPSSPGISGPPASYEDISGQYSAPVAAANIDPNLVGRMFLFLDQDNGTFTGSYAVVGYRIQGSDSVPVTLLGAVVNGTLVTGKDPTLQMYLKPTACTNTVLLNAGSYASNAGTLTIPSAQIPVMDLACADLLQVATDSLTFAP